MLRLYARSEVGQVIRPDLRLRRALNKSDFLVQLLTDHLTVFYPYYFIRSSKTVFTGVISRNSTCQSYKSLTKLNHLSVSQSTLKNSSRSRSASLSH